MASSANSRQYPDGMYFSESSVIASGLSRAMLLEGIAYTYHILDMIDVTLISGGAFRLSQMMELANLSTFVGNLLAAGIANSSEKVFKRNGPHKYPDLLAQTQEAKDVEIKVALEENRPKGHLAKPGYYVTCRYILGDIDGGFTVGRRGDVVWIWELRCGYLDIDDFTSSNTPGDSGKTAVVNKEGMEKLKVVYCDLERLPFKPTGKNIRDYRARYSTESKLFE